MAKNGYALSNSTTQSERTQCESPACNQSKRTGPRRTGQVASQRGLEVDKSLFHGRSQYHELSPEGCRFVRCVAPCLTVVTP